MKTTIIIIGLIILLLVVGCEKVELNELQTEACNTADTAGTCQSRLLEVGIVLPEECCEVLKKCC